jgi:hypothetical protein
MIKPTVDRDNTLNTYISNWALDFSHMNPCIVTEFICPAGDTGWWHQLIISAVAWGLLRFLVSGPTLQTKQNPSTHGTARHSHFTWLTGPPGSDALPSVRF